MEKLLVQIGELIAMEITEVEQVKYVDKDMGFSMVLCLEDGKQVVLTLA